MERPSRWDLTEDAAAAAGGVKWDNSSKDGKFVDVPTLQATPRATPLALHPSVRSLKELQATPCATPLALHPSLHSCKEMQATGCTTPLTLHPSLHSLKELHATGLYCTPCATALTTPP